MRAGSSQIAPSALLPNFSPSARVMSGRVSPCTDAPARLRMRSMPAVMLPHWSEPPTCSSTGHVLVQPCVVVGLQQHVAELRERDAVLARDAAAHRLLGEHVVDRDVLADVAQELDHADRLGPVAVVDQPCLAGPGLEVEEGRELRLDGTRVAVERVAVEEVALLAAPAGIADHARGPARQRDRQMTGELEAAQQRAAARGCPRGGCRRSDRSRRTARWGLARAVRAARRDPCDPGRARARAGRR